MNALLDPQIADRLAKLCGIFGSHHAGERAAAAAKADELVRSHRLTWFDLLLPQPIVVKPKKAAKWRKPRTTKAKLAALRESQTDYPGALNEWEREFVISVSRYADSLSEKQERLVDKLIDKLRDHIVGCDR